MLRDGLGNNPALTSTRAVGECLVGGFHAGPWDLMGVVSWDVGDMVIPRDGAVVAVVVDVIAAGETIPEVVVRLQGVGEGRLLLVGVMVARCGRVADVGAAAELLWWAPWAVVCAPFLSASNVDGVVAVAEVGEFLLGGLLPRLLGGAIDG